MRSPACHSIDSTWSLGRPLKALEISQAHAAQADLLSELARRSKAHWGYGPSFMQDCAGELRVRVEARDYFFASQGEVIMGFYGLERTRERTIELEALFVDPPYIGKGVGRLLFGDAITRARLQGAARLSIQSDAYASDFYRHCGCRYMGMRASGSIPGRKLPVFTFDMEQQARGETVT